jgi:outer membrane murein-binding lipoprotein Lpp
MKRILLAFAALALIAGCSGEDLKRKVQQQTQLLAAQEAEIKKIKDDMAAREADLKNQCEQRIQKLTAQNKNQVDALNARIAELNKKKDPDRSQNAAQGGQKNKARR